MVWYQCKARYMDQWNIRESRSRSPLCGSNWLLGKCTQSLSSSRPSTLGQVFIKSVFASHLACTEPQVQPEMRAQGFLLTFLRRKERCLGHVLYACSWPSEFPVIFQAFQSPICISFAAFPFKFFVYTSVCAIHLPTTSGNHALKQLPVIFHDKCSFPQCPPGKWLVMLSKLKVMWV